MEERELLENSLTYQSELMKNDNISQTQFTLIGDVKIQPGVIEEK